MPAPLTFTRIGEQERHSFFMSLIFCTSDFVEGTSLDNQN